MSVCWVILRGQQIYTVIQAVHWLLYIVAKCHFFSVVTWKDIIKYLQKCEGSTHLWDTVYPYKSAAVHFVLWFIGRTMVFWRKWVALCPKPNFHPLWEGGDVLPAGPSAALKGEDLQILQSDMYLCSKEVSNDKRKQDACVGWVMFCRYSWCTFSWSVFYFCANCW